MRVLELFSGIGGLAAAVEGRHEVVGAVDHDRRAQDVYARWWPGHPIAVKNLVSVKDAWLAGFHADVWWMSPPCAPHGIRGHQRDLDDPRSAAFARLVRALPVVGPDAVLVENVPWFADSGAWALLTRVAADAGYTHQRAAELCPTELGVRGQRRRFYAALSRRPLAPDVVTPSPLAVPDVVGSWDEALAVPPDVLGRFGDALHVVDAEDPDAVAATFTQAYGSSPVYAGSYLRQRVDGDVRLRRFHPDEIARLHGLPARCTLGHLPLRDGWKLVGNGVSSQVVRRVVAWVAPAAGGG